MKICGFQTIHICALNIEYEAYVTCGYEIRHVTARYNGLHHKGVRQLKRIL